jgi:hypothetical protein
MRRPEFAYAQARVQARLGDVLRTTRWPSIEAGRGAAQFLASLRAGAHAHWVEGFDAAVDAHRVESALREKWSAHVAQVARWLPSAWRPATRWFGLLPELARFDAMRRAGRFAAASGLKTGEAATSGAQAMSHPEAEPLGALAVHASELAPFAVPYAATGANATATIWSVEFGRRLPRGGDDADLVRPAPWLLPVLAGDRAGRGLTDERATEALVRLLHRAAGSPAAVLAFVAFAALELERVRGGLLARLLLARAPQGEGA